MDTSDLRMAYITCADYAEAERIATLVVEQQVAACANIFPAVTSVYQWEGRVDRSQEVVVIAKTTASRSEDFIATVRAAHSYSVPCIVLVPLTAANPAYAEWLRNAVSG